MSSANGHLDGVGGETRSALGIAWTCLAIIFACTWTAIHPNIPQQKFRDSEWKLRGWRLIQALWALLVPELMVMWAVQQWVEAGKVSREYEKWAEDHGHHANDGRGTQQPDDVEKSAGNTGHTKWTKVHSFFLIMGGMVTGPENNPQTIHYRDIVLQMSAPHIGTTSTPPDISHRPPLHAKGASEISAVDEKEDVDHRHGHPSDVMGQPLDNKAKDSSSDSPFAQIKIEKGEIEDKSKGDGLAKAIVVIQTAYFLIQLFARVAQRLIITKLEVMTLAYALLCGMLYIFWWHKPYNVQRPIYVSIPEFESQEPPSSNSKGGIARILTGGFILNLHRSIIGDGEGLEVLRELSGELELSMNINLHRLATISSFLTATVFGGVHCIAWNFEFTTRAERLVWNISAALVTTIPLVWISMVILGYSVDGWKNRHRGWTKTCVSALALPLYALVFALVCAYFVCRVILVVEAFVLLRDLPPGARATVDWSSFIPHI